MKKKLLLFIVTLLLPSLALADGIDKYNISMNIEDYDYVSYLKQYEVSEETNYSETIISDKNSVIKTISSSTSYKLSDNIINYQNISNKIQLEYDLSYDKKNKNHREYYLLKNNNTRINKLTFNISVPEENLNTIIRLNGKEVSSDQLVLTKSGNKLYGTIYDVAPKSELTIVLEDNSKEKLITIMTNIALFFPLIGALISYFIWYFFGKDLSTKIKITSHPPKDVELLDACLAYNGEVTTNNITLLLLKLANDEYIRLKEDNYGIKVIKLRDYNGKNYIESLFLRKLFTKNLLKDGKIVQERVKEVYLEDAGTKTAIEEIKVRVNNENNKNKYFEKTSNRKNIYITIITSITLLLMNCVPFIEYGGKFTIIIGVLFSILCLYVLLRTVDIIDFEKANNIELVSTIALFAIVLAVLAKVFTKIKIIYIVIYVVGFVCSFLMLILYKYMPKRTKKGTNILGELESLKLFIETAKTEELKRVLELDNQYIYTILPYTYILDDIPIIKKQFKSFKLVRPIWYETKNITNITDIYKKIDHILNKIPK